MHRPFWYIIWCTVDICSICTDHSVRNHILHVRQIINMIVVVFLLFFQFFLLSLLLFCFLAFLLSGLLSLFVHSFVYLCFFFPFFSSFLACFLSCFSCFGLACLIFSFRCCSSHLFSSLVCLPFLFVVLFSCLFSCLSYMFSFLVSFSFLHSISPSVPVNPQAVRGGFPLDRVSRLRYHAWVMGFNAWIGQNAVQMCRYTQYHSLNIYDHICV